ncbi:MAG: 4Fe-4S dicluster domain-containing protein [Nitrososphaerota archaeon]
MGIRQPVATLLMPIQKEEKITDVIIRLGGDGIMKCYQCGSCTAICPISEDYLISFRRSIKYAQLGLDKKISSDLTPWLCYACGECSNSCPRDANPSELMMTLRRYLTMVYDWTGISKLLYLNNKILLFAILSLSILTGIIIYLFHGPIILDQVALAVFAPIEIVENAGRLIFAVLASILLINIYRMYRLTSNLKVKLPLLTYVREFFKTLIPNFLTQKLFSYCNDRKYWLVHLLIFYGYVASLVLFELLLVFTHTNDPFLFVSPLSIIGLFSVFTIAYGGLTVISGRIKKNKPLWKYSHPTDWMFIILLVLISITGLLTGIFRSIGWPIGTYVVFSLHLMVVVPFLILGVPFTKWAHIAYRPIALYFSKINEIRQSKITEVTKI